MKKTVVLGCLLCAVVAFAAGEQESNVLTIPESGSFSQDQVPTLAAEWVSNGLREVGVPSILPSETRLEKAEVKENFAAVYLTLPAAFLANLDDIACETILREQADAFGRVENLKGFGVWARPDNDPTAEYKPLPAYLPAPAAQIEKPEPETDGLRSGGLPTYNPGRPQGALSGKTVFISPGHGWYYSDTLGRWATQRGNSYGIIEDHSNGEACLLHLLRYFHNAGANVWPCRERDMNTDMVIIDNSDSSPAYTTTGNWYSGTAAGNWYGTEYKYSAVSTSETATATYSPDFPSSNYYAVYVWTPSSSNRPTQAKVRVNHTGGTTEHIINMQQDGNTWRFLGMYYFDSGRDAANGSVVISNQGSETDKYVIADAVRFGGGFGTSGHPRWEESGKYFAPFMGNTGNNGNTVTAMPKYVDWERESWEDGIYISWHSNATGSSWVGHGTDIYVYGPNGPPSPFGEFSGIAGSDSLAIRMQTEIRNDLRADWNDSSWPTDLFTAWFGELNPSYNNETPGVLVETAFHDSEVDAESILDPRFRDMMARSIYQATVKWWYYDHDGPYSSQSLNATLLPEPPTHLAVRNMGNGTVRVSWRAPSYGGTLGDAATGYLVQSSLNGFGFDNGQATTNTYLDITNLEIGDVRFFQVIATNEGGQSFPSILGGIKVNDSGSPVIVVNGFDRNNRTMMVSEDDPYDSDPMKRERPYKMNNYGYIREYAASLSPLVSGFDFASNEAVSEGDIPLSGYDAVIWHTSEESTLDHTFDASERSVVTSYLNGGGSLFVSGAEMGWELDYYNYGRSFYNNYLKADYSADDANTYTVAPVSGSIFGGIPQFSFDDGTTWYDTNYPDVILAYGGATSALTYVGGTGGTAGIVYDGAFKIVHFGFPFETITNTTYRDQIMQKVIEFFDVGSGDPPPPSDIYVESTDASGETTPTPSYVEYGTFHTNGDKSGAPGLSGSLARFCTFSSPNSGTDHASFVPEISAAGQYEVFITWGNLGNCLEARVTVNHFHGSSETLLDQIPAIMTETNSNTWISLGEFWFPEGQNPSNGSIDLSEETISGFPHIFPSLRMYADAVRLSFKQPFPTGDIDGDGDTDLDDFLWMDLCMLGPNIEPTSDTCRAFDLDVDNDVDLADFGYFQNFFLEP